MKMRGKRKSLMGKFSTARCVWAPYSASTGTLTSPMVSRSVRYFIAFPSCCGQHSIFWRLRSGGILDCVLRRPTD